jgi:hypothetical protein
MKQRKPIMSVLRIHKKHQNFIILDKTCLNDKSLSWGAKGLHAYLMSLPDDWRVRVSDLKDRSKNGRDAVRGLLIELEQAGYIQKSNCRDNANGRFGGIEYLVLEIPEPKNQDQTPEPEKPSAVNFGGQSPETGNPSPVSPASEKATLINNKYNNYLNNQVLNKTAANNVNTTAEDSQAKPKAAAVTFLQPVDQKLPMESKPVEVLSQKDALIGTNLTQAQKNQVANLVKKLNLSFTEGLSEEIEFCLLNPKHFTGCGKDFSRKLNAIRKVILRGEWQTPAGMVQQIPAVEPFNRSLVQGLEKELQEAHAEASHFQKLLAQAKEHTRDHFERIIKQTQKKIQDIEEQLKQVRFPQEACCG